MAAETRNSTTRPREKIIIRASIIGIIANALLASFKAFVGIVTGSIAITLDAVNNLSDALSSVITIIGTIIKYRRAFYVVTNKRLIIRTGIIGVDYKSLDSDMHHPL